MTQYLFGLLFCNGYRAIGGSLSIVVTVALLILLCGPCILQCVVQFVLLRLTAFTQVHAKRPNVQYVPMSDTHTRS